MSQASFAPAEVISNFPFTRLDLGILRTDRVFIANNSSEMTTGTVPQTINIDSPASHSDGIAYTLSSGELEFNFAGKVYVTYNVAYRNTSNTRSEELFYLEIDKGSGFNTVEGSTGHVYLRLNQSNASDSKTLSLEVEKGNIIRIRTDRQYGSDNIVEQRNCSFVISPPEKQREFLFGLDGGTWENEDTDEKIKCFDAGEINV